MSSSEVPSVPDGAMLPVQRLEHMRVGFVLHVEPIVSQSSHKQVQLPSLSVTDNNAGGPSLVLLFAPAARPCCFGSCYPILQPSRHLVDDHIVNSRGHKHFTQRTALSAYHRRYRALEACVEGSRMHREV